MAAVARHGAGGEAGVPGRRGGMPPPEAGEGAAPAMVGWQGAECAAAALEVATLRPLGRQECLGTGVRRGDAARLAMARWGAGESWILELRSGGALRASPTTWRAGGWTTSGISSAADMLSADVDRGKKSVLWCHDSIPYF